MGAYNIQYNKLLGNVRITVREFGVIDSLYGKLLISDILYIYKYLTVSLMIDSKLSNDQGELFDRMIYLTFKLEPLPLITSARNDACEIDSVTHLF